MSVQSAETQIQQTPENSPQPNFVMRRLGALALVATTVAAGVLVPKVFANNEGSIYPGQENPTVEAPNPESATGLTIEDKLSDMGLEHQEAKEKEVSAENQLKQATFIAWRKQKGSSGPYSPVCLANYISVQDKANNNKNVFSLAEHCITVNDQGNETGVLDKFYNPNQSIQSMNVAGAVDWEVVIDEAGQDPNVGEPLAKIANMTVNVGAQDSDLLLGTPTKASSRLNDIEPLKFMNELPEAGSKTIVMRVTPDNQLETYEGIYLGRGIHGPDALDVQRVLIQRKVEKDGHGDVNPNLSWAGSSGAVAYTVSETGTPRAMLMPQRSAINPGAINGEEYTREDFIEDLNAAQGQAEVPILQHERDLTQLTILQFGQADELVPALARQLP